MKAENSISGGVGEFNFWRHVEFCGTHSTWRQKSNSTPSPPEIEFSTFIQDCQLHRLSSQDQTCFSRSQNDEYYDEYSFTGHS